MERTDTTDRIRATTEAITGRIASATDNTLGKTAQAISESNERNVSQEPLNSSFRGLLLGGAGLALMTSLGLQMMGRKHEALYVGQWVPTLLVVALWYQLVRDPSSGIQSQ